MLHLAPDTSCALPNSLSLFIETFLFIDVRSKWGTQTKNVSVLIHICICLRITINTNIKWSQTRSSCQAFVDYWHFAWVPFTSKGENPLHERRGLSKGRNRFHWPILWHVQMRLLRLAWSPSQRHGPVYTKWAVTLHNSLCVRTLCAAPTWTLTCDGQQSEVNDSNGWRKQFKYLKITKLSKEAKISC